MAGVVGSGYFGAGNKGQRSQGEYELIHVDLSMMKHLSGAARDLDGPRNMAIVESLSVDTRRIEAQRPIHFNLSLVDIIRKIR